MRAGLLRHRITIQEPSTEAGPYGQTAPTWQTVAHAWAEVKPVPAAEKIRAGQPGMEATYVVTMRYRSDLTGAHRLLWGDRELYISGVTDVAGRTRQTEVTAHERENATDG